MRKTPDPGPGRSPLSTCLGGPQLTALLLAAALLPAPVAQARRRAAGTADVEAQVARVESGLRPRVVVEGAEVAPMRLVDRMGHYRVPGLTVAVVEGGKVRWARGYGFADLNTSRPMTAATRLQAGDLSMLVTGVGALALVRQGQLDLDGDVQPRLRSWKIPASPHTERKKVTVRRLLSHSGGFGVEALEGYESTAELPTLRQLLDGTGPSSSGPLSVEYVPGTRTRHSAGGYLVLQQLMMDVSQTAFAPLMEKWVLRPVGMAHSSFQQPPSPQVVSQLATGHTREGAVSGAWRVYPGQAATGLWTTAEDLARLIVEIQQGRAGKKSVLTQTLATEFLRPGFGELAMGPRVLGRGASHHFTQVGQTDGFEAVLVGYVESGRGAVVLTNGEGGMELAHELLLGIAREYLWPGYAPKTAKRIEPEVLDPLAGGYLLEPLELSDGRQLPALECGVHVEGGQLYWTPSGMASRPVYAEGEDRFFALDGAPGLRFFRDEKGRAKGVLVEGNGRVRRGRRLTP